MKNGKKHDEEKHAAIKSSEQRTKQNKSIPQTIMPVLFIGHGSPMNAVESNEYTEEWKAIAKIVASAAGKPKLLLCISAHWETAGTKVTAMPLPKTIHDFYGFPKELYDIEYHANGSPEFAKLLCEKIKSTTIVPDQDWGLDHGAWSVLRVMYPNADVPVVQLSIDENMPPEMHFALGQELKQLRSEGVLIICSGNVVHNLMMMDPGSNAQPWALDFDAFVEKSIRNKDYKALIGFKSQPSSRLAQPASEHYMPLLYALGAAKGENAQFFCEKIDYGTLSMRCVVWGANKEK